MKPMKKELFYRLCLGAVVTSLYTIPALAQEQAAPTTPVAEAPVATPKPVTAAAPEAPAAPAANDPFVSALLNTYNTNPQIKAQRKVLESVDELVPQAYSGFLPNAQVDYERGKAKTSFNGQQEDTNDTETRQLTVVQPIFRGFQTINSIDRADNLVESARGDLRQLEQQVLLEAVTAYMDVFRDDAVLKLSTNNEEVLERQRGATQERFDVGEVTRTDVSQSEARLSRATTDKIQAEGQLISSRANFARVVGYKPENLVAPTNFPSLPATVDDAIKEALENNPTIQSIKYLSESAGDDTAIQIGQILPEVSFRAALSEQEGVGSLGNSDFDEDSFTVNARIPLYQSGAEYSRVRERKAVASQRKFQLANQQNRVTELTIQAWEDLQTSEATIASQQDAIRAAEVALDGVRQEQLYGSRTILDVLDAEQELFVARVNLVRAEHDRTVAIYNLLATVGRLTVKDLGYAKANYDPNEHYDDVKYQFIGF